MVFISSKVSGYSMVVDLSLYFINIIKNIPNGMFLIMTNVYLPAYRGLNTISHRWNRWLITNVVLQPAWGGLNTISHRWNRWLTTEYGFRTLKGFNVNSHRCNRWLATKQAFRTLEGFNKGLTYKPLSVFGLHHRFGTTLHVWRPSFTLSFCVCICLLFDNNTANGSDFSLHFSSC